MKKLLLSLGVIAVFLFYSTYKQNSNSLLASSVTPTAPPDVKSPTSNPTNIPLTNPPSADNNTQPTTVPPTSVPPTSVPSGQYKDGVYAGDVVDVFYGNVQIQATVQNGKISDVKFLQSPSDRRTSIEINSQAMPMLQSEAIQAQSANVNGVSGATATSQGFIASLGSALAKAK
jgi:uncharacterized protein with FMN-binding domain